MSGVEKICEICWRWEKRGRLFVIEIGFRLVIGLEGKFGDGNVIVSLFVFLVCVLIFFEKYLGKNMQDIYFFEDLDKRLVYFLYYLGWMEFQQIGEMFIKVFVGV